MDWSLGQKEENDVKDRRRNKEGEEKEKGRKREKEGRRKEGRGMPLRKAAKKEGWLLIMSRLSWAESPSFPTFLSALLSVFLPLVSCQVIFGKPYTLTEGGGRVVTWTGIESH